MISDDEIREERAREDREDEAIEKKLRTHFDFFLSYYSSKFKDYEELKSELIKLHKSYGWELEEWQLKI